MECEYEMQKIFDEWKRIEDENIVSGQERMGKKQPPIFSTGGC
jgi:hypothetical protein